MRDAVIIFLAIILAMGIGGYLFVVGTPKLETADVPLIGESGASFVVIAEGQDAGSIDRRTNFRIRSAEELAEVWALIYESAGPAIPAVDFSQEEVIAVFDGSHTTGGYKVAVTEVADTNGNRIVRIRREAPGDTCIVTQAFTSPFQMVRVKKSTLPITKEEETVTTACP